MNLSILRTAVEVAGVSIDEKTVFTHKLMGEHKITSTFYTNAPIDVQIGDYASWNGTQFYINRAPVVKKVSNIKYQYTVTFESVVYNLYNKLFMDEGSADFAYHGTAEDHLDLLLTNINSVDAGWTIYNIDATESKTITYSSQNCRNALNTIAKEFELEWKLDSKSFTMQKSVGVATTHRFEYGHGKGLYSLIRGVIDDANVVTRVYGFGAAKNLKHDYRGGKKRLVFDDLKLEANTNLYGVREGVFTDDSIYPKRTGTVTAIDAQSEFKITDTNIDFDINDHLLEGVVTKIVFKTGALSGYEFEITNFDNAIKEITFKAFVEENDYELPNDLNKPAIGDEYTLIDIDMPQSYIDAAETELEAKTQEYLDENSHPRVNYTLELDEKYLRDSFITLRAGDTVRLVDAELGVDKDIRIFSVTYPLVSNYKVKAVISDTIPYTVQERLLKKTVENKTITREIDRTAIERNRQAINRTRELQGLIYDTDGYFDTGNIKPLSIDTAMLSVGSKSQYFSLNGVKTEMNVGGDPSKLNLTAGQLVHYQIEIDGLGYVWEMNSGAFSNLIANKAYYVFAKCSKTSLTGDWYIYDTPKKVEDISGQYLFLLGVLYSEVDGRRDFDFTKGMTFINGGTITSGKIQSYDGLNFFDLEGNTFRMGDNANFIEWDGTDLNVTNANIDDATIQNATITDALIDDAFIGDWILEDGLLKSAAGGSNPKIEMDSNNGRLLFNGGEIRITDSSGQTSLVNEDGILANGGNQGVYPPSTGINARASFVGLGFGHVDKDPFYGNNFLAGVYGSVSNSGTARSYGGYFERLYASGIEIKTRSISSSTTLTNSDSIITAYFSSAQTIYLPSNPNIGRRIEITNVNNQPCTVNGNGKSLYRRGSRASAGIDYGDTWVFTWDGTYWHYTERG